MVQVLQKEATAALLLREREDAGLLEQEGEEIHIKMQHTQDQIMYRYMFNPTMCTWVTGATARPGYGENIAAAVL